MANELGNPLGFFFGGDTTDPRVNQQLRQRIALAMMARESKFPKNLGEGLSAIGDAIAQRHMMQSLLQGDLAQQDQAKAVLSGSTGATPQAVAEPDATPPAVAAINRAITPATPQQPLETPLTADEQKAGVSSGDYNVLDAQANLGFKPTPGYLQDAIAAKEKNPEMQAYFGHLSAKEAKNAQDVSPTGAAGPYQITRGTARDLGLPQAQRFDPAASTEAVQRLTAQNAAVFERINGRPPTFQELALMHQQGGATGARMVAGTGNAPPGNLAVNNIPRGANAAQAVERINNYYGMPNAPAPVGARDATRLADTSAQPAVAPGLPLARVSDAFDQLNAPPVNPPTAALPGTVSDAPPVGVRPPPEPVRAQQMRDLIAAKIQARGGAMVPPGTPPPATGPDQPLALASPDGVTGLRAAPPPPPQIRAAAPPPAQVAQNAPQPRFDYVMPEPPPVPPLKPTPVSPTEQDAQAKKLKYPNNSYLTQPLDMIIADEQQKRAIADKAANEQYTAAQAQRRELMLKREDQIATQAKRGAEGSKQASDAEIYRRTGQSAEQFFPAMDKEKASVDQAVNANDMQQLARRAIRDGVITGYGANFKVASAKFADWALKNGMSGDMAANTEIMSAALKTGLRQAVETVNGSGPGVSNTDVRIAEGISGSDPQLQMKTIQSIMDRASAINNMKINRYETKVDQYLSGHPQELNYSTNARPVAPPDKLKILLDAQQDPTKADAMRSYFDEKYGPGSAELAIARFNRAQRKGG